MGPPAPFTGHLKIGPFVLRVCSPAGKGEKIIRARYRRYLVSPVRRPDARVNISARKGKGGNTAVAVHTDGRSWEISRADFRSVSDGRFRRTDLSVEADPYSFDSWLRVFFTLFGLRNRGMLLHAAGIFYRGGVYLFPGRSGSGKSTITKLLGKNRALSDEIVLLSKAVGKITGSDTPFWGELRRGTGKRFSGRVKGLFFLRHGEYLSAKRIAPGEAVSRLLSTILFFTHDPKSVGRLMAVTSGIAQTIPAFDLRFSLRTTRREILGLLRSLSRRPTRHRRRT